MMPSISGIPVSDWISELPEKRYTGWVPENLFSKFFGLFLCLVALWIWTLEPLNSFSQCFFFTVLCLCVCNWKLLLENSWNFWLLMESPFFILALGSPETSLRLNHSELLYILPIWPLFPWSWPSTFSYIDSFTDIVYYLILAIFIIYS